MKITVPVNDKWKSLYKTITFKNIVAFGSKSDKNNNPINKKIFGKFLLNFLKLVILL